MGRINRWLLRRMDKLPDPEESLPPKLDQMRIIIVRRTGKAVMLAVMGAAVYVFIARVTDSLWYGPFITIPTIIALSLLMVAMVEFQSRMAVYDYIAWLRTQKPVRSRVLRLGAPYERRAPVADQACEDCPARPGERHSRSCPAIPPQWFRQSPRG